MGVVCDLDVLRGGKQERNNLGTVLDLSVAPSNLKLSFGCTRWLDIPHFVGRFRSTHDEGHRDKQAVLVQVIERLEKTQEGWQTWVSAVVGLARLDGCEGNVVEPF